MANKKITELMAGTPTRDSLIESATDVGGNMVSRKFKVGAVADVNNVQIASEYDDTATYNYGAYRIKDGVLYRCTTAISVAEAWDSTHWTAVMVTGEFRRVVELTSAQYSALSSAEKNNGTLYIITDEETTAADIPYSQGVSVADKLTVISNTLVANTVTYYKVGNVVQLSLVAYSVPANTGSYASRHIIGYLPVGYRPIVNAYCQYVSSNLSTLMVQYTDGEVSIRNPSGTAQDAFISITFITNS